MQNEPVDIVGALVIILSWVWGKEIANLVGVYIAIIGLACAGAGLRVYAEGSNQPFLTTCAYFAVRVAVAITLTVFLARVVNHFIPAVGVEVAVIPVAFGIGWIRDYADLREKITTLRSWIARETKREKR